MDTQNIFSRLKLKELEMPLLTTNKLVEPILPKMKDTIYYINYKYSNPNGIVSMDNPNILSDIDIRSYFD